MFVDGNDVKFAVVLMYNAKINAKLLVTVTSNPLARDVFK